MNLFARDSEYLSGDRGAGHHVTVWGQEALASCCEGEAHTDQTIAGPGQYKNSLTSVYDIPAQWWARLSWAKQFYHLKFLPHYSIPKLWLSSLYFSQDLPKPVLALS